MRSSDWGGEGVAVSRQWRMHPQLEREGKLLTRPRVRRAREDNGG